MADQIPTDESPGRERRIALTLLVLAALNCAFQIAWFWRFRGHNITMDGVNYIGLARHLLDGDFTASVHGYWSPLLSWMIAAGSLFTRDFSVLARCITIASLLLCLPLVYALTFKLWRSHLASALAVFWFSCARGVIAEAVTTIQADYFFVAGSLTYFICLLASLRRGRQWNWFWLGVVHAITFLAKAFAMPWLAATTLLAVLVSNRKSVRGAAISLFFALLVPALMWLTWGQTLKMKYGVFTTGYQLRANLMIDLKRRLAHQERGDPYEFVDTSYDRYMVAERSWSSLQQFKMTNPALVPMILENELHNLPPAIKEIIILLTPGGVLALIVGLLLLTRNRVSYSPETIFAWLAITSAAVLVGTYCMLVFDARYVLPITLVLMAIAAPFLVEGKPGSARRPLVSPVLRKTALGLLMASLVFFTFYWASPFRTIDRDFQISCYQAATLLKNNQPTGKTLVSIGEGPYPEHGMGFEVGVYVAYFTDRHLTAMNSALPNGNAIDRLARSVLGKQADAVLVWGKVSNQSYGTILRQLRGDSGVVSDQAIMDPRLGEVGRVIFFSRH